MAEVWAPAVADVGALLRARTHDDRGNELGTFTADTRPTDVQVTLLIDSATTEVIDSIGTALPVKYFPNAQSTVALYAAMLVELSFFPEQIGSGRSPYMQMLELYKTRITRLQGLIASDGEDVPSQDFLNPAGSFAGQPWPTTWYTPW